MEIDTDAYPFGLHGVDPFLLFPKKVIQGLRLQLKKLRNLQSIEENKSQRKKKKILEKY